MSDEMLVVCFTDGRHDCLTRTIASFDAHVSWPGSTSEMYRLIFDDSADPAYTRLLRATLAPRWQIVAHPRRLGFAGTIAHAWDMLSQIGADGPRWVFHLEDDFVFQRPVDLDPIMQVLDWNPQVVQMAFRRQAWSSEERAAGGVVEMHPDSYREQRAMLLVPTGEIGPGGERSVEQHVAWLEHRRFFTTNPSLYRRCLCARGWPVVQYSEGMFAIDLFREDSERVSAFWGDLITGREWVHHIGAQRVGIGY